MKASDIVPAGQAIDGGIWQETILEAPAQLQVCLRVLLVACKMRLQVGFAHKLQALQCSAQFSAPLAEEQLGWTSNGRVERTVSVILRI